MSAGPASYSTASTLFTSPGISSAQTQPQRPPDTLMQARTAQHARCCRMLARAPRAQQVPLEREPWQHVCKPRLHQCLRLMQAPSCCVALLWASQSLCLAPMQARHRTIIELQQAHSADCSNTKRADRSNETRLRCV